MKYTPEQRAEILEGLLGLRKAGQLNGVWYSDSMGVQIRTMACGEPDYIPWSKAAEMVGYGQRPAADPSKYAPKRRRTVSRFVPLLHTRRPKTKESNL